MAWDQLSGREAHTERSRMHRGISWRNGQAATARGLSGLVARERVIHGALANIDTTLWVIDKRMGRDNEDLTYISRPGGSNISITKKIVLGGVPANSVQEGRTRMTPGGKAHSIRITITASGFTNRTHGGDSDLNSRA